MKYCTTAVQRTSVEEAVSYLFWGWTVFLHAQECSHMSPHTSSVSDLRVHSGRIQRIHWTNRLCKPQRFLPFLCSQEVKQQSFGPRAHTYIHSTRSQRVESPCPKASDVFLREHLGALSSRVLFALKKQTGLPSPANKYSITVRVNIWEGDTDPASELAVVGWLLRAANCLVCVF